MEKEQRKPQINKYPLVDCTNDYVMVKEGLRVPALRHEVIERDSRDVVKKHKKAYAKLKKNLTEFKDSRDEIIRAFLKNPLPQWGNLVFIVK